MRKLMVVDDEAIIALQLSERLRYLEYDVVGTASSGEESVRMARKYRPDLILMDIVMKGKLDGIDAAKKINEEMDIPTMFLTAYVDDKYLKRAMEAEPFGYIVKPFRENEIRANIEIAIHKKELERKQKQAEERTRRLFLAIEHNPYMVIIMDAAGKIEYTNSEFTQTTNYTPNEVAGENISFLKSDETLYELYKEMWDKIASGEEWRGELTIRKKDGTPDLKYVVALPLKNTNDDIVCFLVVMEEITKREKWIGMLLQSKKMILIRTIVAGIAHEFNNILAVVHGSASVLEGGYKDEEELNNGLQSIMKSSDEGAEIIRNMVKIVKSDKDASEYILFDIRYLIKEAIDLTIPGWKNNFKQAKDINFHVDTEAIKEIPEVFCDTTELREVFINIIKNALDAMHDGGRISFCTWSSEGTVFVSISDTGKGMSEEVKWKMFDPFFTTRRPPRTGLGMSVVYGIMKRHDGTIKVESEEGKGTTLTLSIPIKKETA